MQGSDARRHRETWETWARTDPLFAILSDPAKLGGGWSIDEFMAHTPELDVAFAPAAEQGLLPQAGRVLDFGCGVGRMTQALGRRFDEVVGIDISEAMVTRARALNQLGERCSYVTGDLSQFADGSFDLVFSIYVIQHIPASLQRQVLRDLVRVTSPRGLLVLQIAQAPARLVAIRRRLAPRWLREMLFRRRFHGAPLIEMNPLSEKDVRPMIAPAKIRLRVGEWYYITRTEV